MKAVSKRRRLSKDPWTFTLLGFLLSIEFAHVELEVVDGPEVIVTNPDSMLKELDSLDNPSERAKHQSGFGPLLILDCVGAAFWEAAERKELIGTIVFASIQWHGVA